MLHIVLHCFRSASCSSSPRCRRFNANQLDAQCSKLESPHRNARNAHTSIGRYHTESMSPPSSALLLSNLACILLVRHPITQLTQQHIRLLDCFLLLQISRTFLLIASQHLLLVCYRVHQCSTLCKSRHHVASRRSVSPSRQASQAHCKHLAPLYRGACCLTVNRLHRQAPGQQYRHTSSSLCRSQLILNMHIMVLQNQEFVPSSPLPL